ncbi:2-oxoglutarate dehydrogenase E1 component [Erythrobacter rubeus]|uniref:2-oxoglutarate dehydrogenase E1 component n=1 Tax=Erythrobacter rubeus TaxID=2760803 RepID=A0ABR8KLX4_9SPHN|nr:2-oxoglutarate dehydrogenase E1 component [Erythrobacter rubeus]MBD2841457.1 2-oxoglutarate dehydrogenase E1 component [Erythrobacter rubeus]
MGQEPNDFLPQMTDQEGPQPGPSWGNPKWLDSVSDAGADLTTAMDPTQMRVAVEKAAKAAGKALNPKAIEEAAANSISAMTLVRLYRVRGHMAADLDPLGLSSKREEPEDLTLAFHGLAGKEAQEVFVGGVLGLEWTTVRELHDRLRAVYCGKVGLEYMHIADTEERRFLQDKFESPGETIQFTDEGKKAILAAVLRGEQYEEFLGKKYVGTKRFGLDGGESMIPALEAVIKHGGSAGVREIIYGMAHRGRLNVLANVMEKPYKVIFHEFSGGSANPEDVGGSGDVKYHLGTSTDRTFDGIEVHMSLVPNPSHLETVNPVVLGKTRAQQAVRDGKKTEQVLPVLIHGDAAFAGQGVVWESLSLSGVPGYDTGGCLHFIINNQIGFTTSPNFARSSPYPSDVAKGVMAPILHVNGDDPEAVTFACKLAVEYRQKFGRDVVIDMWCYRRFGHNEGDEPSFTQPLMYEVIRKHPKVSRIYAERLIDQGVIDKDHRDKVASEFVALLDEEFEAAKSYNPNEADWFGGRWAGLNKPADPETARRNIDTAIEPKMFDSLGRVLTEVPDDVNIHKTLGRVLKAKAEMFESGDGFDWATAEALAYGSLVMEGYNVRLSGQDSGRGTFSQRHAVWVDQDDESKYIPLNTLPHGKFEVHDSTLSEYGVLGFEYGFAMADPKTLVLWEAQFGDFANGAQIMIDQYIASGEVKWLRANGLVMLLPHGYEGQGPEHSSARLERFLQLCANDNIQVCNITTPANYFHVLRRQMLRPFRKPLIIMTPKSLLRHPLAKSPRAEFEGDHHFMRIKSDMTEIPDEKVKRLILCSGKVAYDLMEKRDEEGIDDISIVRIEQLYPFPGEPLTVRLKRMTNLEEIVWCQEEPKNNGAWFFVDRLIELAARDAGFDGMRPIYAGREVAASPATGLAKRHVAQQEGLVSVALDLANVGKTKNRKPKRRGGAAKAYS